MFKPGLFSYRRMKRSMETSLAWLALFLAVPSLCLATDKPKVEPSAEFSIKGTNGYLISVDSASDSASIVVTDESGRRGYQSFAEYSVKDTVPFSVSRIEADFGDFGSISMTFVPNGEIERRSTRRPENCGGPRDIVRRLGAFVGTIRFTGENGYTTAEALEVSGSIGTPEDYFCIHVGPSPQRPFLQVTNKRHNLGVAAMKTTRREQVRFEAASVERKGEVSILRYAIRFGPPSSFDVSASLRRATITPPPPFSGTATFRRTRKGSPPNWSGSLTVSFPGRPDVSLTGPEFTFGTLSRF